MMFRYSNGNQSRWNQRDQRNERALPDRNPEKQHISPWESGVAPGVTPSSLLGDYGSNLQNQYLPSREIDRQTNLGGNGYEMPSKRRRTDGIFSPPSRSSYPQRLGNTSSARTTAAPRRTRSTYYPSDNRRGNNSRRPYKKPNRPARPARSSRDRPRYNDKKSSTEPYIDNASSKDGDAKCPSKVESEGSKDEKEEKKVDPEETVITKGNDSKKEKIEDSFPPEILYCHVCDLNTFTSKKGFIRHLEGVGHAKMATKFHEKNDALLEYLRVSAKFAEMRRKDYLHRTTGSWDTPLGRITEKVILFNYLEYKLCCQKKFTNSVDLHEHKLSVLHLKNKYNSSSKEKSETEIKPVGSVEEIDEVIRSATNAVAEEPLSVSNIPPYDPNSAFGMQYAKSDVRYTCNICECKPFKSLAEHCQSFEHYEKIVFSINKEEENKMEEERKLKEVKIEQNKEKTSIPKYERLTEEDCASNFSDKNNEDEKEFLSYEDYMKEDDEMIILDEEMNYESSGDETQTIPTEENNGTETVLKEGNNEPKTITIDHATLIGDIETIGEDFNEPEDDTSFNNGSVPLLMESQKEIQPNTKLDSARRRSRVRQ